MPACLHSMERRCLLIAFVALVLPCHAQPPKAPVPVSPYLPYVYRYADAMLDRGRDTYGPQKTGLFLSALDRNALTLLTNRPAAPSGIREGDRVGVKDGPLVGANPQHDENLLRLLYALSELSAKPKYREGADGALRWFLQNAAPPPQNLPWGLRGSWNVITDSAEWKSSEGNNPPIRNPFFRPWLLWDLGFDLAPQESSRFAVALWSEEALDRRSLSWSRHAGFCLRTWAVAYARTKDEKFLKEIELMLDGSGNRTARRGAPSDVLSLAIDFDGAAHRVPEPLAARLRAMASREDEVFCSLAYPLKTGGGYLQTFSAAEVMPTPRWTGRYGSYTTAQMGMMCVSRYDNTGHTGHRDLMLAAAEAYLDSLPGEGEDIWPGTLGQAISLQIAAWRHTARPVHFERARKFADLAVVKFWGTNALPRASIRSEHYESITGADTLALALLELHLQVLHITAVRCPPNTVDR